MRRVEYVGPLEPLRGKRAIAQDGPFRVQFDGYEDEWRSPAEHRLRHPETGAYLGLNWHVMPEGHFKALEDN